jgi:hypothetical protein
MIRIPKALAQTIEFPSGGGNVFPNPPSDGGLTNLPVPETSDLGTILSNLKGFAIGLGITIASLMVIYAAYQMMTSGGNEERFAQGKKTLTYALVGLGILLLAATLVALIQEIIGV